MRTEDALLAGARRFDEQALAEIYDLYSTKLFRYAWRNLGDPDVAEDCVAETFSRFLNALKHGRGPKQYLQAYLFRTAHNWISDYYRRQPPPPLSLNPEIHADRELDPSKVVMQDLELQRVRSALRLLTPEQRQVIILKYLEGWDHVAIAETMGKTVGSVKALQHRAINSLRRIFAGEEEKQVK